MLKAPVNEVRRLGFAVLKLDAGKTCIGRRRLAVALTAMAALLLCGASRASGQGDPAAVESQFQAAMAAQDRGDLSRAEGLLRDLHTKHPGIFAVDESLGLLYVGQERFAEALPWLRAAAKDEPKSDTAHVNLGANYYKLHRDAEALQEFEEAARLNPKNAATLQSLGELRMRAKQPEQAAEAFATAARLRPGDADLIYDEALAWEDAGQPKAARDALDTMPGLEKSAAAQSLYGDIAEKLDAYQEAVQHYTNAATLDPSESNLFMLGAEFLRHWTFEAAIREFEFAASRFPSSAKMQLGLGVAYYGNGNYDKAIGVFSALMKGDPKSALYAELMGRTCTVEMAAEDQRCEALIDYAKRHPENAMISTFAATGVLHGLMGAHQEELAQSLLQSAIKADPKHAPAQYQMGVLLQVEEQWEKSIPHLEAAIHLDPKYSEAHYRLGLAYARTGRKDAAQSEMALFRKYNQQAENDRNAKLRQITLFVVEMR